MMSKEVGEKRCKTCKKLLVDEKFFCSRCILKLRDQVNGAVVGPSVLVSAVAKLGVKNTIGSGINSNSNSKSESLDSETKES